MRDDFLSHHGLDVPSNLRARSGNLHVQLNNDAEKVNANTLSTSNTNLMKFKALSS